MELTCPKGHGSSESDFCSECGVKMSGAGATAAAVNGTRGEACPDCGAAREGSGIFCEICGHNFATGARGQIPMAAVVAAAPVAAVAQAVKTAAATWTIEVAVDATLREEGSPEAPAEEVPFTVTLKRGVNLIGRRSTTRAIFPEVALDSDDAVSHRHALLTHGDDGTLALRDIGSSNGTRVNGKDVAAMTDVALQDGDAITLGHWTRLTVRAES